MGRQFDQPGQARGGILMGLISVLLLTCWACVAADQPAPAPAAVQGDSGPKEALKKGGAAMGFRLSSTAFELGQPIPKKYTGDGADASPPLRWTDPSAAPKSFALICDDPDAPVGTWVHWVLWGIAPAARSLEEAIPAEKSLANGIKQGTNDFRKIGYGGPAPPPGNPHRYFFRLYALDNVPDLKPGATKKDLLGAMKDHILAEAELMGTYNR